MQVFYSTSLLTGDWAGCVSEMAFHNSILRSAWTPMMAGVSWHLKPVYQACLVSCVEITIIRLTLFSKSVNFKCHCFSYKSSNHINYGRVTFYTVIQSQWPQLVDILLLSQLSCIHGFEVSSFSVAVSGVKKIVPRQKKKKVLTFTLLIFWWLLKSNHRQVSLFFWLQGKEFFSL